MTKFVKPHLTMSMPMSALTQCRNSERRSGKLLKASYFEISAFMQVIPASWDEPCEIQLSSCKAKNTFSFVLGQMMMLKLKGPRYTVAKSKIPAEFSDYPTRNLKLLIR